MNNQRRALTPGLWRCHRAKLVVVRRVALVFSLIPMADNCGGMGKRLNGNLQRAPLAFKFSCEKIGRPTLQSPITSYSYHHFIDLLRAFVI